jgi:hypothetical protein
MEDQQKREEFDTGLSKIRHEIKSRLVLHGFFGIITYADIESADHVATGSNIELTVKGKTARRSLGRAEIESCRLRVDGPVLLCIISMIDELSA